MLTFIFAAGLVIGFLYVLYGLAVGIGFVIMGVAAWFRSRTEKTAEDLFEVETLPEQDGVSDGTFARELRDVQPVQSKSTSSHGGMQ